jgi:AcrR family transcriptional regulator
MERMRVDRAKATKGQLIEEATALFAERGYEATSIEAVLQRTGVSRGALYHHFKSKEALFEAVYESAQARVAQEVIAEALAGPTPIEVLRRGTRSWLRRVRDDPVVRQITLIDAPSVLGWGKWRDIDQSHFLGGIKSALQEAGGGRLSEARVEVLAHVLLASLGEVAMMIARGDRTDQAFEEGAALVDDLLTRTLS